jgi:phosphopantetheine--protein transferase-like protein
VILGVGVDIVQTQRFKPWLEYSKERLLRVFSQQEIDFIFSGSHELAMQRMSSRYAAKEAFYKALSATLVKLEKTEKSFAFLSMCKAISIASGKWEVPEIVVDWNFFEKKLAIELPKFDINFSMSHEKDYAVAYVIISKK